MTNITDLKLEIAAKMEELEALKEVERQAHLVTYFEHVTTIKGDKLSTREARAELQDALQAYIVAINA